MDHDSGYCSETSGDFNRKLYEILESYDRVAKSEQLLQWSLSPRRRFSAPFMKKIMEMQYSIFKTNQFGDEPRPPFSYGDFLHITQMIYERVKQLMVMKNLTAIYLNELDVDPLNCSLVASILYFR